MQAYIGVPFHGVQGCVQHPYTPRHCYAEKVHNAMVASKCIIVCCSHCRHAFAQYPCVVAHRKLLFCTRACWRAYYNDESLRFWSRVCIKGFKDCWEWQGACDQDGYGLLGLKSKKSRTYKAHRYAFEYMWGPFDEHLLVLHGCDNPPCVNPWHLHTGTLWTNAADRRLRGRYSGIERNFLGRASRVPL